VDGAFVEPEKLSLPEGSAITLATRGDLLLVASQAAVRLYDVKQKKHLASLEGVFQPRFWPRPGAPSGKPAGATSSMGTP
jgi:hypothetical protein